MNGDVPEGWATTTLSELFDFKYGRSLPRQKRNNKGPISVYGSNGVIGTHDEALTKGPTIVIGRKGSVGEIHLSRRACWPIDTTYFIDEFPAGLQPDYWALYLASRRLGQEEKSSAIPGVSRDDIYALEVQFPPFAEQARIAAKLQRLFLKVNSSREKLTRTASLLKRFRQSILTAAASGRLTEDWRQQRGCSLDDTWVTSPAESACESVQSGSTPAAAIFRSGGGVPFLKVYNIVKQRIEFEAKPQYIDEATHRGPLKRSIVRPGDILMNIVGPPLGKVAIVPSTFPEWNINQALVLFRPKRTLSSRFLYYVLCSGLPYTEILRETRGSAGQSNISLSQCRAMELPLPPSPEQREIARRVDTLIALADRIEARCNKAMKRIEALMPSLLAKAFRGELVPTEAEIARQEGRDYEPATVLIERILRERTPSAQDAVEIGVKQPLRLRTKPPETRKATARAKRRNHIERGGSSRAVGQLAKSNRRLSGRVKTA